MDGLGGPELPELDLSSVAGPEGLDEPLEGLAGSMEGGLDDPTAEGLAGPMDGLGGPELPDLDVSSVAGDVGAALLETDLSALAGPADMPVGQFVTPSFDPWTYSPSG